MVMGTILSQSGSAGNVGSGHGEWTQGSHMLSWCPATSKTLNSLDNNQSAEDTTMDFGCWPDSILVGATPLNKQVWGCFKSHNPTPDSPLMGCLWRALCLQRRTPKLKRISRVSEAEGPAWQNHHSGIRNLECWWQARWGVTWKESSLRKSGPNTLLGLDPQAPISGGSTCPGCPWISLQLMSCCPAVIWTHVLYGCALNVSVTICEHHGISNSAVEISRTALQALTGFVGGSWNWHCLLRANLFSQSD